MCIRDSIKPVRINPASVATVLTAGQAFKLSNVAGQEVIVDVAAITEVAYGVAIYNPRKNVFVAGDTIDLACEGSVIFLETTAAIARGAGVANTVAGPTVATVNTATQATLGVCLDKPTASGQLARIEIKPSAIVA